jgi:hypothetical protein
MVRVVTSLCELPPSHYRHVMAAVGYALDRLTEFDALMTWPIATMDNWRALSAAFKADDGAALAELTGAVARYGPLPTPTT